MNFTFLLPRNLFDRERNTGLVVDAIRAATGLAAAAKGRNDIVVGETKVSGAAFRLKGTDRAMHHGTLLVDVDMATLGSMLTPSKKKLESKGVESVRARVANLKELHPQVTKEALGLALVDRFSREYGPVLADETMSEAQAAANAEIRAEEDNLRTWTWTYAKTPEFSHKLEERFAWGSVTAHLDVQEGRIVRAVLFSDVLVPEFIEAAQAALTGVAYDKGRVIEALTALTAQGNHHGLPDANVAEFATWLSHAL